MILRTGTSGTDMNNRPAVLNDSLKHGDMDEGYDKLDKHDLMGKDKIIKMYALENREIIKQIDTALHSMYMIWLYENSMYGTEHDRNM